MTHPYRNPGISDGGERGRRRAARHDDRVLAGLMIGLGGLRVALALANHEAFGAEASIAALMTVLGAVIAVWG